MTPLEALNDLSKLVFIYGGVEQYKIIETALKALEIIKEFGVLETYTLTVNIPVCKLTALGVESDEENLKKLKLLKEVLYDQVGSN